MPSIDATTGTSRVTDVSNASATVDGVTCTTSTPNGACTCSGVTGNSRLPARAPCKSSTATTSPAATRLSAPEVPRTRTSTVDGASPWISRPAGNCCSSSGTRKPRSTVSSPDTVIHNRTARPTDISFSPTCRNGHILRITCTARGLRAWTGRPGAPAGATSGARAARPPRDRVRSVHRRQSKRRRSLPTRRSRPNRFLP